MRDTYFLMVKILERDKDKRDDSNAYKIKKIWTIRCGDMDMVSVEVQIRTSAIFAAGRS